MQKVYDGWETLITMCDSHVRAYLRHQRAVRRWAQRHTYAGWLEFRWQRAEDRCRRLEARVEQLERERNAHAWADVCDFLKIEPHPATPGALAPAGCQ